MLLSACESDRSRGWMMREGGARTAFLDARESAPDSSSSLVCTWKEHGLASAARQWIDSTDAKDGEQKTKWVAVLSKGKEIDRSREIADYHSMTVGTTFPSKHHHLKNGKCQARLIRALKSVGGKFASFQTCLRLSEV